MALDVYREDRNLQEANKVYQAASSKKHQAEIGMYGFGVVADPHQDIGLSTYGAGPCTIILVHGTNGYGALGHYAGTAKVVEVIEGVHQMVNAITKQAAAVQAILFAAGDLPDDPPPSAPIFRVRAVQDCKYLFPNVTHVEWIGRQFGTCYYLPKEERAAFYEFRKGDFANAAPGSVVRRISYVGKK